MSANVLPTQKELCTPTVFAWLVCTLGAVYYCYEYFLRIAPSVMLPELMRAYHLNGAEVGSLSAFYYHAYVPMQIVVGLLMDRFSPRRLLTFACLLCAIGTYLFTSGQSLEVAKLGRFLVGFGSAFAFVGALKLATIWLPPKRFALVSGIIVTLGMAGAMVGDILLRALVDTIGWKVTLYTSAAAGLVLAVALWVIIRDVNPYQQYTHAHLVTFKTLLYGLFKCLGNTQIWFNGLIGFLMYISLSAFAELWGIPYLTQAHHLSNAHAATANSMMFLGWAVGSPFWGWFSDFIGVRRLPIILSSIGAFILVCILLYSPPTSFSLPILYILLLGFGILSSVQILVFSICREITSLKITGTAVALTNMFVMIGGNIFQPVIGKLLDMKWGGTLVEGARVYSQSDYRSALIVLPVSILISILITFFIRETYCKVNLESNPT